MPYKSASYSLYASVRLSEPLYLRISSQTKYTSKLKGNPHSAYHSTNIRPDLHPPPAIRASSISLSIPLASLKATRSTSHSTTTSPLNCLLPPPLPNPLAKNKKTKKLNEIKNTYKITIILSTKFDIL